MNYLKLKDFNLRLSLAKKENSLLVNKFLFVNLLNSNKILSPKIIKYFLSLKKKNIFGTRIVNRCVITNSDKSTSSSTKISRKIFRDLLRIGIIPGHKKSVW